MARKLLGIIWRDRKRATWIREQRKAEYVLMTIKMTCALGGHIMLRIDNRWTKRVYQEIVRGAGTDRELGGEMIL